MGILASLSFNTFRLWSGFVGCDLMESLRLLLVAAILSSAVAGVVHDEVHLGRGINTCFIEQHGINTCYVGKNETPGECYCLKLSTAIYTNIDATFGLPTVDEEFITPRDYV